MTKEELLSTTDSDDDKKNDKSVWETIEYFFLEVLSYFWTGSSLHPNDDLKNHLNLNNRRHLMSPN